MIFTTGNDGSLKTSATPGGSGSWSCSTLCPTSRVEMSSGMLVGMLLPAHQSRTLRRIRLMVPPFRNPGAASAPMRTSGTSTRTRVSGGQRRNATFSILFVTAST